MLKIDEYTLQTIIYNNLVMLKNETPETIVQHIMMDIKHRSDNVEVDKREFFTN